MPVTRVAVLALDGVYPFELGIPSRLFGAAEGRYTVATCSVDGNPVATQSDFDIAVTHGPELLDTADIVVIASIAPRRLPAELPEATRAALARIPDTARIVSICTGAFILAAAGLLDGRRATTHWELASSFSARYPEVGLDADVLFVEDGRILTSAGAASGIDACLHVIRQEHGSDVASRVARQCVVPPFREGGQAQYIERPLPKLEGTGLSDARAWALSNIGEPFGVKELAAVAGQSVRSFTRHFTAEAGVSPGQWVLQQRILEAQRLLETSDQSVDQVAANVGFSTGTSLRKHFRNALSTTPRAYRNAFRPVGG